MNELDEIKRRKLAELQAGQENSLQEQAREQAEFQQKVNELESVVKQLFTKEALERYGNIKAADPDKALRIITVIGQLIQSGRVGTITDEMLKSLLKQLAPKKRDIKINRA